MPDELTYDRAVRRIPRFMAGIAAVGTVAAFAGYGWKAGGGFLAGAMISGLNFWWLKGLVDKLGGERPRGRGVIVLAGRYLLLGLCGYVIFRFIPLSLPAVAAGVFVLTAAVFTEVVVEIAYARK
jgi:hypothetical protein